MRMTREEFWLLAILGTMAFIVYIAILHIILY